MDAFAEIMKGVENQQVAEFQMFVESAKKNDCIPRRMFLFGYLATFLGNYFPPGIPAKPDAEFDAICHEVIDSVSLSEPEIDFMHAIVDQKEVKTVNDFIDTYNTVEDLPHCQLGDSLRRCLDANKDLNIRG